MMDSINLKERQRKVAFDFSLHQGKKNTLLAKDSVNCDCRYGTLKSGIGGAPLLKNDNSAHTCPLDNVTRLVLRKTYNAIEKTYVERFGALTEEGKFYTQETNGGAFVNIVSGAQNAGLLQYAKESSRYNLAIIGEGLCSLYRDDDNFDLLPFDGLGKFGCFFAHRLFLGMMPSTVICSAPGNDLDFTESLHDGGLLRFPHVGGQIVAMKVFKERLYVFFEYGILKVNAAGAVKDFSAEILPYTGGKINGKTVCVGARGVYFMAADGAYRFDGESANPILANFVLRQNGETELDRGAAFSGRIFLQYQTKIGRRTLVVYEDNISGYYMDALPILSAEEGGMCLFTDVDHTIYQLSDGGDKGYGCAFSSEDTDFGIGARKTLTNLYFSGKGSFTLTVKTGGKTSSREVVFQDGAADVKLSERGERFAFSFELPYGSEISGMTATYTTIS